MTTPTARFHIDFESDTSGIDKSNSALDKFRASIQKDMSALKEMADAMKNLGGTTEVLRWQALPKAIEKSENEVVKFAAKMAKLKADFAVAPAVKKESIFAAGLQTGNELEKATAQLRALKGERDKLAKTEPVRLFEDLKAGAEKLKGRLGESQIALSRLGGTMQAVDRKTFFGGIYEGAEKGLGKVKALIGTEGELKALGVVFKGVLGTLAAMVAVGASGVGFVLWAADAARNARLLREAASGGAEAARGLYDATLRVEDKTGASRDEVVALANEYARLKFSMGAIEGATTAITIASQTMGSQVGSTIKGLVDRGRAWGKFSLLPFDLKGTGIAIHDVAVQLAKATKNGVGAAENALRSGTVKIEDGVKALGAAFEASHLGKIAKEQALAIGVQFGRAKDNIGRLFDGVKIDGFLEKLDDVLGIFKETSETGKVLKQALTAIFQPFVDSATESLPLIENLILRGTETILEMAIAFKEAGGAKAVFESVKGSASDLWEVLKGIATTLKIIVEGLKIMGAVSGDVLRAAMTNDFSFKDTSKLAQDNATTKELSGLPDGFRQMTAKEATAAGLALTAGIAAGVTDGMPGAVKSMTDLAVVMHAAFDTKIERHSPSRLFRRSGKDIPRGTALGIEDETPVVARALSKMAEPQDMSASDTSNVTNHSGNSSTEDRSINLTVHYQGGGTRSDARRFGQWLVDELETLTLAKGLRA